MLRKPCSAQVASCKVHQNAANTEQFCANTTQPRDSNTKRPKYCMLICLAFWFWPTIFNLYIYGFCTEGCLHTGMPSHMGAFTQRCFSQRHVFTHTRTQTWCFYTHMPSCTGAFLQGCFYSQELLHTDAQAFLHTDAFTQRCFHTGILLHTTVAHVFFTRGFSWHKVAFTHRSFYRNTLTRYGSYTGIHLYRGVFTKRWFLHRFFSLQRDAFTHGCF